MIWETLRGPLAWKLFSNGSGLDICGQSHYINCYVCLHDIHRVPEDRTESDSVKSPLSPVLSSGEYFNCYAVYICYTHMPYRCQLFMCIFSAHFMNDKRGQDTMGMSVSSSQDCHTPKTQYQNLLLSLTQLCKHSSMLM